MCNAAELKSENILLHTRLVESNKLLTSLRKKICIAAKTDDKWIGDTGDIMSQMRMNQNILEPM